MKKTLSFVISLSMFLGILILSGSAFSADSDQGNPIQDFAGKKVYTTYNMWYEAGKENALWCINYKTGIMIPAGTEVSDVVLTKIVAGRTMGAEPMAISFITASDQKKYYVNIIKKYHPGKTIEDYSKLMFSEKDFSQLTQGMSQTEIEGIKEGVIKVGMSKKAVIVSYGYPPEHKTPDLNGNLWTYWRNKFATKAINFDDSGKTIKPEQAVEPDNL
jgi:hypothetical protein